MLVELLGDPFDFLSMLLVDHQYGISSLDHDQVGDPNRSNHPVLGMQQIVPSIKQHYIAVTGIAARVAGGNLP